MLISILERLETGPATSRELQDATGLSQASVSRQLTSLGDSVVKLRGGRSTQYALARNAFGVGNRLPLYAMDPHGNTVAIAHVRPLANGGYFVERTTGTPAVLLGERGDGVFDDLPFFLDDLRPQGFLGRQIALALSEKSDFPSDPRHWSAEHVGAYLVTNGDDLPGNLMLGEQVYMRLRGRQRPISRNDYPEIAEAVLGGEIPGSSAGGEQPKFTAYTEDQGHVIVKFASASDDKVSARWRDILLTEYHAAQVLQNTPSPAAVSRLYDIDGRLFLESSRFDRHGERGRMPMISLLAVDMEYTGLGTNWVDVMGALASKDLVSSAHAVDATMLYLFGRCINNTDMHLGNLSLAFEGGVFRLLPVYDMCSMGFAPRGSEVLPYSFTLPATITSTDEIVEGSVMALARQFWSSLAGDERISEDLRAFLDRGLPV